MKRVDTENFISTLDVSKALKKSRQHSHRLLKNAGLLEVSILLGKDRMFPKKLVEKLLFETTPTQKERTLENLLKDF